MTKSGGTEHNSDSDTFGKVLLALQTDGLTDKQTNGLSD
jgi:hypothetical protein